MCRANALPRHAIRLSSSNGLVRKQIAPYSQRAGADAFFGDGGNEDEGHGVSLAPQPDLQLDPAHSGHADVGNHAPRVVQLRRFQKGLGGGKDVDDVTQRSQEIVYRGAN